jgi:hypothetical protein
MRLPIAAGNGPINCCHQLGLGCCSCCGGAPPPALYLSLTCGSTNLCHRHVSQLFNGVKQQLEWLSFFMNQIKNGAVLFLLLNVKRGGSFCSKKWNGVIQPNATLVKMRFEWPLTLIFLEFGLGYNSKWGDALSSIHASF